MVGILKFQMNPLSPRWGGNTSSVGPPPLQKTIFLGNTSVLGIRALNNVGTWVTYWKWWLYAGGSSPDRSCSILRLLSSTCRLRLLSAFLPLSSLDLLGVRNPTNCRQSHICRIFTLMRYWPPLSSRHTIANSSRVYTHVSVCVSVCMKFRCYVI